MARINGEANSVADNMTISGYLAHAGYRSEIVAVEYNERILGRNEYDKTIINSDDVIEIVSFMGGGK